MEEENIGKPVRKTGKMRKLEKKIARLNEKNQEMPKESITKKIAKLEKKKANLEKWLRIKLPFRFLIKLGTTWLMIGGVCYGCSYVPVVKELKSAATAAIAYVAPEPVGQVIDIVTLNFGVSNQDFEWLKTTLKAYISGEIELKITDEPYEDNAEKTEALAKEVLGTGDLSKLSITDIIGKIATNATPDIISQLLDMMNLTEESRERLEQDMNRALKILPKLNNSQMNELVEMLNGSENADGIRDETREQLQKICESFVEEIRRTGSISNNKYKQVTQQVQALGVSYPLEIEAQRLDVAPKGEGENQYYTVYTGQIAGELAQNGKYTLKQGDIIRLSIGNIAQYSGMVLTDGK